MVETATENKTFGKSRLKVCIVAPQASPMFRNNAREAFAEIDIQAGLLAESLSHRSAVDVSVVVAHPLKFESETVGKIRLINIRPNRTGNPVGYLRTMSSRLRYWLQERFDNREFPKIGSYVVSPNFLEPFKIDVADVYCLFGVDNTTISAAAFARIHGKRIVWITANDMAYAEQYFHGSRLSPPGSFIIGDMIANFLDVVDSIVVSSSRLMSLAHIFCGIKIKHIAMPVKLAEVCSDPRRLQGEHVLWMGESGGLDHIRRLTQHADKFLQVPFKIVHFPYDPILADYVRREGLSNVEFFQYGSRRELESLFERAAVVVTTSKRDDMPTALLLAGKYARPILTLFDDADGVVEANRIGLSAGGSMARMHENLERLLKSKELWDDLSANMANYITERHSGEALMAAWEDLLNTPPTVSK